MTISTVIQRGTTVHVYGANNRQLFVLPAGSSPGDGLQGYTSHSITIRRGRTLHIYNEKGRQIGVRPV